MGDPETCIYRRTRGAEGGATCQLLGELLGRTPVSAVPVSDEACRACCQQARPSCQSLNEVVASLVLEELAKQKSRRSHQDDNALRQLAVSALPVCADQSPPLESLVDHGVTADTLAQRIEQQQPFILLRFGDGEWLSMLGVEGYNCDRHVFLPQTMGRELRQVLHEAAADPTARDNLWIGTTCELAQEGGALLASLPSPRALPWVSDAIFRLGMANLQTQRFVIACRRYPGKKVIVGNARLRPVARALQAHHVIIPLQNCYTRIDEIERQCRAIAPQLLLCCASMASECLLWRLRDMKPNPILVDCGSIFDVMLMHPIRAEYHDWTELIAQHYFPIFRPFVRSGDVCSIAL